MNTAIYDPEIIKARADWRKVVAETDECPVCLGGGGWLVDVTGRADYDPESRPEVLPNDEWIECLECDGFGRLNR